MRLRNPTSSVDLVARLGDQASPRLLQWLRPRVPALIARVERAQRRAAFTVYAGDSPSKPRATEVAPVAPAPRTGESVDLGAMISQLTDPRSRDVRTVAGKSGGGVPLERIEIKYSETGLLPEPYAVKSVKEAEKVLNWLNQTVAANRKKLNSPYYKTVVRVRWRDGAVWEGRFDVDGVWQTHDLFGEENTGGGVTWENTTDKNKVYNRTGEVSGHTFKVPKERLKGLVPARPIKSIPASAYGGLTVAPGTWLYMQLPGANHADAVQLVKPEAGGSWWSALRHGGATPWRVEAHGIRQLTHGEPLKPGNYSKHYGFLEQIIPDARYRKVFIERAQQTPVEEAAARQAEEARKAKALREHGPWFATVLAEAGRDAGLPGGARALGYADVGRFLKSFLHKRGIEVKTGVRSYSMASGMDFHSKAEDKEKLERLFPGITHYHSGIYPFVDHEDRSDMMTDYHDQGGFRVAPNTVESVKKALVPVIQAAVARGEAKKKAQRQEAPKVWASQWKAGDFLIQPSGAANSNDIRVYEITGPGRRKSGTADVARPQMVEVALSSVWRGKRAFYNKLASDKAGKGVGHDVTPDFTFAKLLAKGGDILRKYMPEAKGRRVLVRGSGWYGEGPGTKYENYAHDVTTAP